MVQSLIPQTAHSRIAAGAEIAGLSPAEFRQFVTPERDPVRFPIRVGGWDMMATIVIQDTVNEVTRGGLAFTPGAGVESTMGKAAIQSPKNKMGRNPAERHGGAKSGIKSPGELSAFLADMSVDPFDKQTVRYEVMREFVKGGMKHGFFGAEPGGYSFAGDENTGAADMDAVQLALGEMGIFAPFMTTGNTPGEGTWGVEGRDESTGRGVARTARNSILTHPDLIEKRRRGEPITMAIHGFGGDVASHLLQTIEQESQHDEVLRSIRVTIIGDATGSYRDDEGIKLNKSWDELRGIAQDEKRMVTMRDAADPDTRVHEDSRATLVADVDMVVGAAYGDVVATAEDIRQAPNIRRKAIEAKDFKAKVFIEAGNGCVTWAALNELDKGDPEAGVTVEADVYANSAGSRASWEEYLFGLSLVEDRSARPPSLTVVRNRLDIAIDERYADVHFLAEKYGVPGAVGAMALALTHWKEDRAAA